MTTLIIARHGNTFEAGETPRRVGARTDLPLVEKGRQQAAMLGRYLKAHDLLPDAVYCSTLQRTRETAEIALREAGLREPVHALSIFDEIDYGPDEDKPEEDVIGRIGTDALARWDRDAVVPEGWKADPDAIRKQWMDFAAHITRTDDTLHGGALDIQETVLVVTSNGIARFAPYIAGNYEAFCLLHTIKLSTGALGILRHSGGAWSVVDWNIRPA
ncbi:MAG: histidine phosphatase family protein [Alphaproteobacteria bacterium]|nr:histidine phosphatase family protein [Alphaproteobacteria bacterium]